MEQKESRLLTKKHTLDSDEEDDKIPCNKLDDSDIEGQEETTVDIEKGIRFTPFNMRDELEEGHFDADGMYIFKRTKDDVYDQWIEDVNWTDVKKLEKAAKNVKKDDEDEADLETDEKQIYKEMLTCMKPGESVLNAIKRLGNKDKKSNSKKNVRTWKIKRIKTDSSDIADVKDVKDVKEDGANDGHSSNACANVVDDADDEKKRLVALIGCADKLLLHGYTTIYQDTFEKLTYKLNAMNEEEAKIRAVDADIDIFSDSVPSKSNTKLEKDGKTRIPDTDEVSWEFKWKQEDDAELHGPFNSHQMLQWADDGYFENGVYVRKCGASTSEFYSSTRIDFGLYL